VASACVKCPNHSKGIIWSISDRKFVQASCRRAFEDCGRRGEIIDITPAPLRGKDYPVDREDVLSLLVQGRMGGGPLPFFHVPCFYLSPVKFAFSAGSTSTSEDFFAVFLAFVYRATVDLGIFKADDISSHEFPFLFNLLTNVC